MNIIIIIIIHEFHRDASLETKLQGHIDYGNYSRVCPRSTNFPMYASTLWSVAKLWESWNDFCRRS